MIETMLTIQSATIATRERLNDSQISTRVDCGNIQVVRVIPVKGRRPDVVPLSDWMPVSEGANHLRGM